ncbi:MAG: type II toxin-antitoxin system Phd/YefM family antitoxin [Anaerolineae bacterium]
MPQVSVTEAKKSFSEFLNRAAYGNERIVVTSHDKPKAAVISIEDLRRLEQLEDIAAAMEADAEFEAGETLEWESVKDEL